MPDASTQQAIARQQARIDAQSLAFTEQMNQAAAAIDNLNAVAADAEDAIVTSAQDRAALHHTIDALTLRVADLERRLALGVNVKA